LLITAAVISGSGGTPYTFTDDPLVVNVTNVKAVHLTELRAAVDQARIHAGLSAASWAEPISSGVTLIKASHISELRARLAEARTALGLSAASYTDPNLTTGDTIKAAHIQELRGKANETITAGGGTTTTEINWLVADQLGTPRMIFDKTGSLANTKRHDYLPFGEELIAGQGGRTTQQGYAADTVRQKFTSKERDIETGLDYFGARYYSSVQGRFTSPDKNFADQFQTNPQSWDSYSYVRNSPCGNVDVKGRCSAPAGLKPGQVGICIEAFIAAKTIQKGPLKGLGDGRGFSGDDPKLTSRFTTEIIVGRNSSNTKSFDVTQTTTPGTSVALNPLAPIVGPGALVAKGTADTRLNGTSQNSDGTSKITVPIGSDGTVNFNVSTIAKNGIDSTAGTSLFGDIKSSFNMVINSNTGQTGIDASSATGFPSMAIYSYVYEGKNIVTNEIRLLPEGSPGDLDKPMKPVEPVKPR
jgi:RHS repeat-associated protein